MRYDAEHKQRTRERVLKEAAKAIRRDGPHKVSVAAVMAKAGLTHGGFYAHFGSRDELIAEGVAQMFGNGSTAITCVPTLTNWPSRTCRWPTSPSAGDRIRV